MHTMQEERRYGVTKSLVPGLAGILLLTPASYFMLTILIRLFGVKSLYYWISPSFLQSPFDIFSFHKAQFIIGCLVAGIVCNILAIIGFRLQRGSRGLEVELSFRRRWFNTAVALQGALLLVTLIVYTLIQHLRY